MEFHIYGLQSSRPNILRKCPSSDDPFIDADYEVFHFHIGGFTYPSIIKLIIMLVKIKLYKVFVELLSQSKYGHEIDINLTG